MARRLEGAEWVQHMGRAVDLRALNKGKWGGGERRGESQSVGTSRCPEIPARGGLRNGEGVISGRGQVQGHRESKSVQLGNR